MDANFINEYVKKQRALIDDLQSRLLLSETKVIITEQKLTAVHEAYNTAQTELHTLQQRIEQENAAKKANKVATSTISK